MKNYYQVLGFIFIFIQVDKLTNDQIIRFLVLLFLLVVSYYQYIQCKQNLNLNKVNNWYIYFVIMISMGIVRSSHYSVTPLNILYRTSLFLCSTFFIYTSIFLNVYIQKNSVVQMFHKTIIIPVGLYIFLNLLFWYLGVSFTKFEVVSEVGDAVMLSNFGISLKRVVFPLAGGFNTYGDLLGVILLISFSVLAYKNDRTKAWIILLVVFMTLVSLLMVDSRSFLANAMVCALVVFYLKKTENLKFLKGSQVIFLISPIIISLLIPILISNGYLGTFNLARAEESGGTFERVIIWTFSLNKLSEFELEQLFGYGEYGHFGSGASKLWASLFSAWTDSEYISPHNTILSVIFDYGYVGLFLYILLIQRSIGRSIKLLKVHLLLSIVALSFWLYFFLSGSSETLNGFYSNGIIYVFEIIIIMTDIYYFSFVSNDSQVSK